jgi:xylulokinase
MKYLLGIDFGGGASKATLLSEEGKIIAENTVEYPTYYDAEGMAEQAPEDWLRALAENTHVILEKSRIAPTEISAIAIDSATHTSLVTDGEMRPLQRAMHWTDSRSRAESATLLAEHGEEIFEKTYHKPDTIWTLPQLLWLKNHKPELFAKVKHIFFEKDYIRYFLTGVYCTDYIEAEGSMLFDCREMKWDESLCALASVRVDMLPPLRSRPILSVR